MLNRSLSFLSMAFLFFTDSACDSKRFYEENKSIESGVWLSDNYQSFSVNIDDTLARYDLYLNVRNDGVYPYSNLYLFIHTIIPGNSKATDTVECQLADADGKWRGSASQSQFQTIRVPPQYPARASARCVP